MKQKFLIVAAGAAALWLLCKSRKQSLSGMTDNIVSLDNIRRGVKNGWYSAELTTVDGKYAVRLSGKTNDGSTYTDVYPINESDYYTLLKDGLQVVS